METDVLSGGTRDSPALVWNSIQHGCKQRWKESMVDLHSSTWAGKGTKLPDVEKTIQLPLDVIIWYTCCKKKKKKKGWIIYGCYMKSILLSYKEPVVLCRKSADNSHKTNLAIGLCRLHSTWESGQRISHSCNINTVTQCSCSITWFVWEKATSELKVFNRVHF